MCTGCLKDGCIAQGCTTREAIIVGSVVAKVSIPVLHGAAALFRLASVTPDQWIPSVSHMMAVLIDKKYSLPLQVGTSAIIAADTHARGTRSQPQAVAGDLFSPCKIVCSVYLWLLLSFSHCHLFSLLNFNDQVQYMHCCVRLCFAGN